MRKFCDGGDGWGGRVLLSLGTTGGDTCCRDMASHVCGGEVYHEGGPVEEAGVEDDVG